MTFSKFAPQLFALLLVLVYSSGLGMAIRESEEAIAEIGIVKESGLSAYGSRDLTGSPLSTFALGDKIVVLSRNADIARLLLGDGSEGFVSIRAITIREGVTLADAMVKVRYFEKMADEESWKAGYWEKQGSPWVALVARTLGSRPDAATLPPPVSTYEPTIAEPTLIVKNDTSYSIRIYLTGTRTVSKTIAPRGSWTSTFPAGSYRVVAEVTSGRVTPLRTTWTLQRGYRNDITLYIVTR